MTLEERVKTLIGDLMVSLQMRDLEVAELRRRIAELEGPHPVERKEASEGR